MYTFMFVQLRYPDSTQRTCTCKDVCGMRSFRCFGNDLMFVDLHMSLSCNTVHGDEGAAKRLFSCTPWQRNLVFHGKTI